MEKTCLNSIINRLRKNNATITPMRKPVAAVIIPLFFHGDKWQVIFEKRAGHLSTQPGDICFPGGRIDEGESAERTAVREMGEELFIGPEHIMNLLSLGQVPGPGGDICIYTCIVSEYDFRFSAEEVGEVFCVDLEWFLNNEPREHKVELIQRPLDDFPYEDIEGGREYRLRKQLTGHYFYYWQDKVIWGFSAKVIYLFAQLINDYLDFKE